jgi:hypothetical protein
LPFINSASTEATRCGSRAGIETWWIIRHPLSKRSRDHSAAHRSRQRIATSDVERRGGEFPARRDFSVQAGRHGAVVRFLRNSTRTWMGQREIRVHRNSDFFSREQGVSRHEQRNS